MLDLHKIMAAFSRIEVNHDGNGRTALDPMTWDEGCVIKPRASSLRVTIDHASLPGPPGVLDSSWSSLCLSRVTQEDVAVWSHIVNILLEFTSFLATLRWLQGAADLEKYGISFFLGCMLCMREVLVTG